MNKDRAATYLAQGLPHGQVASIMGCSPGYISQLMRDEGFKKKVEDLQASMQSSPEAEEGNIVAKYNGLEHHLLKAIHDSMANAELPQLVKALEVVGNRQDKIAQRKFVQQNPGAGAGGTQVYVQLTLPTHAIPAKPVIEMNKNAEVVAIDGRPMAPMASSNVAKMFAARKAVEELVSTEKELFHEPVSSQGH